MESHIPSQRKLARLFPTLPFLIKVAAAIVIALVALVVLSAVTWDIASSVRLRRVRARVTSAGVPLLLSDLAAEKRVTDESQNAANLYEAAFSLMEALGNERDDFRALWEKTKKCSPGVAIDDELLTELRTYAGKRREIYDALRKARNLKECAYHLDYSTHTVLLPHLSKARECGRMLALAMALDTEEGRGGEGLEKVRDGVALSRSLSEEPFLISHLVAMAIANLSLSDEAERVVSRGDVPSDALEALQAELWDYAESYSMRTAFEGELASVEAMFGALIAGEAKPGELGDSGNLYLKTYDATPVFLKKGLLKADEAFALERLFEMVEMTGADNLLENGAGPSWVEPRESYIVSRMILPGYGRAFLQAERHKCRLRAAATALAAVRFMRDNGRWPYAIDEMAPEYIPEVPQDPFFDGAALVYRVTDDGIIVYSVGENRRDDGGDEAADLGTFRVWMEESGQDVSLAAETGEMIQRWRMMDFPAALAEARALGIPTTMEEFNNLREAIPAEENAATYYEEAFGLISIAYDDPALMEVLPIIGSAALPEDPSEALPPETLDAIRQVLEANSEALSLLHRGTECERCAFTVEWDGYESQLPHLAKARQAARLLTLAAILDAEEGRGEAASLRMDDALALSRGLSQEPTVIASLIAFAVGGIAVRDGLSRAVARGGADGGALEAMQSRLGEAAGRVSVAGSFDGEIAAYADIYREMDGGNYSVLKSAFALDEAQMSDAERTQIRATAAMELELGVRCLLEMREAAANATPEVLSRAASGEFFGEDRPSGRFFRAITGSLPRVIVQAGKAKARLLSAEAAVAAARYRNDNGHWPARLDALVPRYIETLPLDPFTGEALLYRVEDEAAVVYSRGPEGGEPGDFDEWGGVSVR